MKKFSIRYYETKRNDNCQYEEVMKEEIEAKYFKIVDRMAMFSDDVGYNELKAVFRDFISIKELPDA